MWSSGSMRKSQGLGGLTTRKHHQGLGGSSMKENMSPPMSLPNLARKAHLISKVYMPFCKRFCISSLIKMSNELKTTFVDLDKEAFRAYAHDLVEAGCEGPPRQRLQAYMLQTIAQDRGLQAQQQLSLSQSRMRSRQHQEVLEELVLQHMHDYGRSQDLFTEVNKTDQVGIPGSNFKTAVSSVKTIFGIFDEILSTEI